MKQPAEEQDQDQAELCPRCGSVMVDEDGACVCPSCDGEIDWGMDEEDSET